MVRNEKIEIMQIAPGMYVIYCAVLYCALFSTLLFSIAIEI